MRIKTHSRSGTYGRGRNNGRSRSGHDFRIDIRELHGELSVLRSDETKFNFDGTL